MEREEQTTSLLYGLTNERKEAKHLVAKAHNNNYRPKRDT